MGTVYRFGVPARSSVKPLAFDGDVQTSGAKLGAPAGLLALIGDFLSWSSLPPRKPAELATTAARLCRFLRDEVLEQLQADNAQLKSLAADWRTLVSPMPATNALPTGMPRRSLSGY